MSGGGSKTETSVQRLELPEWINRGSEQVWNEARRAAASNPITAYTGALAPGSNASLDQAGNMARSNAGAGQADLDRARQLTEAGASGSVGRVSHQDWDSGQASRYMNPYQEQVQQRTLDLMHRQNAQELDSIGDAAQRSRAYGGTRHAVLEAETRGNQNRNMLDYLAQSNESGYNDAYSRFSGDRSSRQGAEATNANLAGQDFARTMAAGGQFANIGNQSNSMSRADIDTLLRSGLIDQETAARMIDGDYQEFLRMQDAPMMRYMQLMGMLSGAPSDRTQTGTTTTRQNNGIMSTLLGVGSIAASAFSDERLKENIKRVGKTDEGLGVYTYNYKGDTKPLMGVMAQEVEKKKPEAMGPEIGGYKTVMYGALGG